MHASCQNFASSVGATLAFLLSRYLFRDVVQRRFGDRTFFAAPIFILHHKK